MQEICCGASKTAIRYVEKYLVFNITDERIYDSTLHFLFENVPKVCSFFREKPLK